MKLHEIPQTTGGRKRKKRVGSGMGSGLGKTCGRGIKGSKARSGYSVRPGFEGGQMPLYRKLPHRGFNNKNFRQNYLIVNVSTLDKLSNAEVDRDLLVKVGAIARDPLPLKVLGNGEISRAVTVTADRFSASARAKIEAAGGKVIETAPASIDEANANSES